MVAIAGQQPRRELGTGLRVVRGGPVTRMRGRVLAAGCDVGAGVFGEQLRDGVADGVGDGETAEVEDGPGGAVAAVVGQGPSGDPVGAAGQFGGDVAGVPGAAAARQGGDGGVDVIAGVGGERGRRQGRHRRGDGGGRLEHPGEDVLFEDGARERGNVGRGERAGGDRAAAGQPAFGGGVAVEAGDELAQAAAGDHDDRELVAGVQAGVARPVQRTVDAGVGGVGVDVDQAPLDETADVTVAGGFGATVVTGVPPGLCFGEQCSGGGDAAEQYRVVVAAGGGQIVGQVGVVAGSRPVHHGAQALIEEAAGGEVPAGAATPVGVSRPGFTEQERVHQDLAGQP